MKPTWIILERIFEDDSTLLRDFYVNDTTLEDWQKLLDWLRAGSFQLRYSHPLPPHTQPLPDTAEEIFNLKDANGELLTGSLGVTIGASEVIFYFNGISDMDFDVSVRELTTRKAIQDVLDFMKGVGRIIQKLVDLTPEMSYKTVLLRYDSLTDELTFNPDKLPHLQVFGSPVRVVVSLNAYESSITAMRFSEVIWKTSKMPIGRELEFELMTQLRTKYGLLCGEPTVQNVLINLLGRALQTGDPVKISGRNVNTGDPVAIEISAEDLLRLLASLKDLKEKIKYAFELSVGVNRLQIPDRLIIEISAKNPIRLTGMYANVGLLADWVRDELQLPVRLITP